MTALLLILLGGFAAVQAVQLWRGHLPGYGGWPDELLRSVPIVVIVGMAFFSIDALYGAVDGPDGARYVLGTALLVLLFLVGGAGLALIVSVYAAGRPTWLVPPVLREGRPQSDVARSPEPVSGTALAEGSIVRHPRLLLDASLRIVLTVAAFVLMTWVVLPPGMLRWAAIAVVVAGILWGIGSEARTFVRVDPGGLFIRDPLKARLIAWRNLADIQEVEQEGARRARRIAILLDSGEQVFAHALQAPALIRSRHGDAQSKPVADLRATIAQRSGPKDKRRRVHRPAARGG